jgi:hypothetical protein
MYAPDDLSRGWGQGQRSPMLYINEMDKYLQNGKYFVFRYTLEYFRN